MLPIMFTVRRSILFTVSRFSFYYPLVFIAMYTLFIYLLSVTTSPRPDRGWRTAGKQLLLLRLLQVGEACVGGGEGEGLPCGAFLDKIEKIQFCFVRLRLESDSELVAIYISNVTGFFLIDLSLVEGF